MGVGEGVTRGTCTVRYIKHSYWNDLSRGSSRPTDTTRRINEGANLFVIAHQRPQVAADEVRTAMSGA
jgi:hypothetical protein